MALILATAILEPGNHIPADRVTMSAVFDEDGTDNATTALHVFDRWERFFNVAHNGQQLVCSLVGSSIDRTAGACQLKAYALDDFKLAGAPLGSPVASRNWTMGARAAGASDYPEECAICVSFHASTVDVPEEAALGRPAARRRGRFYFGPLASAGSLGADGMFHVAAQPIAALSASAKFLAVPDPTIPADNAFLQVWSRSDGVVRPVVGGHVDNEFDTQRRRGLKATSRTLWTLP